MTTPQPGSAQPVAAPPTPAPPVPAQPSYLTPGTPIPTERPTSVTVLASVGIVVGAMGLLCKPTLLVVFVVQMPVQHPVAEAMKGDAFIRLWMVLGAGTGVLISLLLLLSSIGSLTLKPWARTGMLAYAVLALLMTGITHAVTVLVIQPELEPYQRQAAAQQPGGFQPSYATQNAIGIAMGLWLPLLILFFFTRRRVREAFADQNPAPAGA